MTFSRLVDHGFKPKRRTKDFRVERDSDLYEGEPAGEIQDPLGNYLLRTIR